MTRFEAYLNAWVALSQESERGPEDYQLSRLADDMNPYWYGSEDSKDIYIYQRYSELWITEGTTYTPSDDNLGFTFAKMFFSLLPASDERFEAGRKALVRITQEQWQDAAFTNASTATYLLTYYLLSRLADLSDSESDFLAKMNPFTDMEGSGMDPDNLVFVTFLEVVQEGEPRYEPSFDLALSFLKRVGQARLAMALRRIGRDEWDRMRSGEPLSFRIQLN